MANPGWEILLDRSAGWRPRNGIEPQFQFWQAVESEKSFHQTKMLLFSLRQIRKFFGADPVLDGVNLDVHKGERIGLIGPNGCGKSTMLKVIAGQLEADGGRIDRHRSASFGYLEQQPQFSDQRTLWEEAESALAPLKKLAQDAEDLAEQIADAPNDVERAKLGAKYDQLQHALHQKDAYHLDHKVSRVLGGLGFEPVAFQQTVNTLSGGQQNRLLLAKLLLEQPDIMLLDEPSNHLDIDATQWLEDFLVRSASTLFIVSHDRYLLDKVTNRTVELFDGTIESYQGNFSAYWKQKAERLEVQRRTYEKQQDEIAKLEDFIRRHHVGLKAGQAEDRRKKLERIERVPPPREIKTTPMGFPKASRSGDIALRVEHLEKSFERLLFQDLTFDIKRGERWAVMGSNGSGKTTLLRCILGHEPPDTGSINLGTGVRVGYFDQRLELVDPATEAVEAIRPDHKEMHEPQRRDLLGRFGIVGDMAFQPIGSMSGGEKNRVALARLSASDANFLILDEPTNHLDIWACDALERAVRQFDGTVLFVSHDRYFINQVADHLLVHEQDSFRVVYGDFETYRRMFTGNQLVEADNEGKSGDRAKRQDGEQRRKRKFPYRKTQDVEEEIAELETQRDGLTLQLSSLEVVRNGDRTKQIQREIGDLEQQLGQLYEHWEECVELN